MKPRLALAAAALLLALPLLSCGGGGGDAGSGDRTPGATRDRAEQTPVDEPVRAYAQQLCDPFQTLVEGAADTLRALETPGDEANFDEALAAFGDLQEPLTQFRDDVEEIDPPDEVQDYHEAFLEQLDYAVEALEVIAEGGLAAAFALDTPPATPESLAGLEDALANQCGEDLRAFIKDVGGSLFGAEAPEGEAATLPPARGGIGEAVRSTDFELLVHAVEDPVLPSDESFGPEEDNRWVAIEVSITNVSDESQDYGPYDFKLRDADNFEHDPGFVDLERDLSSGSLLPGDTIRGQIGFEVPADTELVRLVFHGFIGEGNRIDIDLR